MNEEKINIFLQSRAFSVISIFLLLVMAYIGWLFYTPAEYTCNGLLSTLWIENLTIDTLPAMLGNVSLIIASAIMMIVINKSFTFIGEMTSLFSVLYMLMMGAVPQLASVYNPGTLMLFVVLVCMLMLFSLYEKPTNCSLIYLIFAILSAGSLIENASLFLIPVFILGVMQVRAFSFKGLLAIIFGCLTPYWIVTGLGIVDVTTIRFPYVTTIFQSPNLQTWMLGAIGLAILAVIAFAANLFTLMKYKLQTRVYNGFILIISAFAIVMSIVDFTNLHLYYPILVAGVSMQMAHYFAVSKFERRYIILLVIIAAIIVFYVWQLMNII